MFCNIDFTVSTSTSFTSTPSFGISHRHTFHKEQRTDIMAEKLNPAYRPLFIYFGLTSLSTLYISYHDG